MKLEQVFFAQNKPSPALEQEWIENPQTLQLKMPKNAIKQSLTGPYRLDDIVSYSHGRVLSKLIFQRPTAQTEGIQLFVASFLLGCVKVPSSPFLRLLLVFQLLFIKNSSEKHLS